MEPKPFLPDQQVDQTKPARSAGKTVLLWFLLILMFVAIYQLFATPSAHRPEHEPGWSASWLFGGGMLLLLVGVVGYFTWLSRAVRRYNSESAEALSLLARGDLGAAGKRFEALSLRWKWPRSVHAVARHNVAWTLLRQGELKRAIDAYAELERTRLVVGVGGVWQTAPCHLAIAHALAGDLESATRWCEEGSKRLGTGGDTRHLRGLVALARAIIECRRGGGAGVARDLERDWTEFESVLGGEIMRPLRLVRAFAVAHDGGLRGQGAIEMLLMPLRGAPAAELAFMAAAWPEMRAFLAAHPL